MVKGDEVADRGVVELGHRPGLCGSYLLVRSVRAPLGFWSHWCKLPAGHGLDHECDCGERWSEAPLRTVETVASCPDCGPKWRGLRPSGLGLLTRCETCQGEGWVKGLALSRVLAPGAAPVRRWAQLYRAAA